MECNHVFVATELEQEYQVDSDSVPWPREEGEPLDAHLTLQQSLSLDQSSTDEQTTPTHNKSHNKISKSKPSSPEAASAKEAESDELNCGFGQPEVSEYQEAVSWMMANMHNDCLKEPVKQPGNQYQPQPRPQVNPWQQQQHQRQAAPTKFLQQQYHQLPQQSLAANTRSQTQVNMPKLLTTVMMRNIPSEYTRAMLLDHLDSAGFSGLYDMVYLPINHSKGTAFGYAFVNLIDTRSAERLMAAFSGFTAWYVASERVCEVSWNNTLQGLEAHVARYRDSPMMRMGMPDEFKPAVFSNGRRIAFPGPTRRHANRGFKPSRPTYDGRRPAWQAPQSSPAARAAMNIGYGNGKRRAPGPWQSQWQGCSVGNTSRQSNSSGQSNISGNEDFPGGWLMPFWLMPF